MRLFLGGHGLLGTEMQELFSDDLFPTKKQLDITSPRKLESYVNKHKDIDLIIHMAGITDTRGIENNKELLVDALNVNIVGTCNVVNTCMKHDIKLIYISSDYVFRGIEGNYKEYDPLNPVNKYAWSKLGGECAVRLYNNSLIIRTSFCANEFPYDKAFDDQWTTRTSVREFAGKLYKEIYSTEIGIKHIFGKKQTVYELAKELSPEKNIKTMSIEDIDDYPLPGDTSLSTIYPDEEE